MSGRTSPGGSGFVLRGLGAGTGLGARLAGVLDETVDADRMRRGRSTGRSGVVTSVRIGSGVVSGEVGGSQLRDFSAEFRVRRLDAQDRTELVDAVRRAPGVLAALVSGRVPDALAARLLPADTDDMGFDCTCPDGGRACKHAVALALLAAQEIQRAPVRLLTLRGMDPDALIDAVGESASGAGGGPPAPGDGTSGAGSEPAPARTGADAGSPYEPAAALPPLPEPGGTGGTALDLLDTARLRSVLRLWGPETGRAERDLEDMYRRMTADEHASGGAAPGVP